MRERDKPPAPTQNGIILPVQSAVPTVADKFLKERLECLQVEPLPEGVTQAEYNSAKEYIIKSGQRLPQKTEGTAFYWFNMGCGWDEIASKLNVPIPMLVYSAFFYKWFERKEKAASVRAGEKITRADAAAVDLVSEIMVATAALYRHQLTEAIKDPSLAGECGLIPKNLKEMQVLLMMMQSLQTKELAAEKSNNNGASVVNVNIANLSGGENQREQLRVSHTEDAELLLPAATEEEATNDRIELLKLLRRAKV